MAADPSEIVTPPAKVKVTGVVKTFNDAKGFGLITPDLGGPAIFAHQSSMKAGSKKLKATQRVEYDVETRPEGDIAANIRLLD